MGKKFNLT